MTTETNPIVAFHIGRGGRFHNPGFLTFIGENKIGRYLDDLFLNYENAYEVGEKIKGKENLQAKFEKALEGNQAAIAFFKKIGLDLGEMVYTDCNGNPTGLTEEESKIGIGRIVIDGGYNTTYTCYLSDCSEDECQAILNYTGYVSDEILSHARDILG